MEKGTEVIYKGRTWTLISQRDGLAVIRRTIRGTQHDDRVVRQDALTTR